MGGVVEVVGSEGTFVVQRYILTFDKVALGLCITGITIIIHYQYTNVLYLQCLLKTGRGTVNVLYCKCITFI